MIAILIFTPIHLFSLRFCALLPTCLLGRLPTNDVVLFGTDTVAKVRPRICVAVGRLNAATIFVIPIAAEAGSGHWIDTVVRTAKEAVHEDARVQASENFWQRRSPPPPPLGNGNLRDRSSSWRQSCSW